MTGKVREFCYRRPVGSLVISHSNTTCDKELKIMAYLTCILTQQHAASFQQEPA